MFVPEDEPFDRMSLVARLKQRSNSENRRRRSVYAALSASLVAWLAIGRELLGNHWLLEALAGLGIAFGAGFIMSIFAIYQICKLELDSGSTKLPVENLRIVVGVFVGMFSFCMGMFAIYQICTDLAANPVPGGWNIAATLTAFVGTYLTTSWGWRES